MSVTVIIPARYASTRLPGKPLLAETGKPLIQHVVENVRQAQHVDRVVVATDDDRIAAAVRNFDGEVVMTAPEHTSGTDRLAEAADQLYLGDDEVVVNVQGDEPDIPPVVISELILLLGKGECPMATLCTPLPPTAANDPSRVKVVFDRNGKALYFSRAPIPYPRDIDDSTNSPSRFFLHLGIYAYRVWFLKDFARLSPTPAEKTEKLEQLRALEHGFHIATQVVQCDGAGIDTPEDYAAFVLRHNGRPA
jgi:3-deoxy-manno-octulosonate cytidylyltransferase (CMP-KDO synthetase)